MYIQQSNTLNTKYNSPGLLSLLEKTAVYIYITEQMFILHKDVLIQALQSNPDRFFVACFDKVAGEEKKIPYNDYVLNYQ